MILAIRVGCLRLALAEVIKLDAKPLLFIHPKAPAAAELVIDELARKMAGAPRQARVPDKSKRRPGPSNGPCAPPRVVEPAC